MSVWGSVKHRIYDRITSWVSPIKAFSHPVALKGSNLIRYADLLDEAYNLKLAQDLQKQNIKLDWWPRAQVESRYVKDKVGVSILTKWNLILLQIIREINKENVYLSVRYEDGGWNY